MGMGTSYILTTVGYENEEIKPSVHHLRQVKRFLEPLETFLAEVGMPGPMIIRMEPRNTEQDTIRIDESG